MAGVATFTNNPNANTGISLSGGFQPSNYYPQGSNYNPQSQPIQIQGTGTPNINLGNPAQSGAAVNNATAQNNAMSKQISDLLAQIRAQQSAYAPPLNLTSIYNQARGSAEANVNPFYTKQLNDFISQQGVDKSNQQQQTQMNIQSLQDQLANTLSGNATTQARTGQDVLQNEQQINQQADQVQQDQGTQFDQARIAQAKQLASQGLTGSGVGNQQTQQSQDTFNTTESRQAQEQQQHLQTQELFKSRTFEDLARSGELAKQSETKGETQANFDLNKYIQNQGAQLEQQKQDLEQKRLGAVSQETSNQSKLLINQFINSLSNPAQRQAALQAYGGF